MKLSGRVELYVGKGFDGDNGSVRLDEHTMEYLGVRPGDEVCISSLALSLAETYAKVAEAQIEDKGRSVLRVSNDIMRKGNFKVGMRVLVGNHSPMRYF
ncbi:hypothetical protein AC481_02220 [miscellaneous Crenarchaeota group archaeon SMTZ-80]|nr:MAG: hypothetical protein AC481_02220 [miscellaneous Crenarchaeota group archaeon SMTZ-80]